MQWYTHLLVVGGAGVVVSTAILLLCLRWGRPAFAGDYPPDIQAAMPEFGADEVMRGRILGPLFLLSLLGAIFWTTWSRLAETGGGFVSAYGMALATFLLFALVDLLLVDWLLICWWRPGWVVIPGTEDAAGWDDYGFHFREQIAPKALVATFVLPAVIAGVALLVPH